MRLLKSIWDSDLYRQVARSATGTLVLSVSLSGLHFVTGILLARLLGTAGYGAYTYAFTWIILLSSPAGLGLSQILVRDFAAYRVQSAWGLMRGLQEWANLATLCASIGLAAIAGVVAWVARAHLDPQVLPVLLIALAVLPLLALLRVPQSVLRGLNHVILGQMPEALFQPVLLVALLLVLYVLLGRDVTAAWAMGANVLATGIALLVATQVLRKRMPQTVKDAPAVYQRWAWFRSAMPLLLVGGLFMINSRAVTLVLGTLAGAESAGLYNVAVRGAEILSFALTPVVLAIEPHIASLYAAGKLSQLQSLVTRSTRIVLLGATCIAAGLLVFSDWFLLLFGPGFTEARYALFILIAGQLFNFAAGLVITLSVMTGCERDVAVGVGLGGALNVILSPFFISAWGLEGAALATTVATVAWNAFMVVRIYARLGIDATALGIFGLREEG